MNDGMIGFGHAWLVKDKQYEINTTLLADPCGLRPKLQQ